MPLTPEQIRRLQERFGGGEASPSGAASPIGQFSDFQQGGIAPSQATIPTLTELVNSRKPKPDSRTGVFGGEDIAPAVSRGAITPFEESVKQGFRGTQQVTEREPTSAASFAEAGLRQEEGVRLGQMGARGLARQFSPSAQAELARTGEQPGARGLAQLGQGILSATVGAALPAVTGAVQKAGEALGGGEVFGAAAKFPEALVTGAGGLLGGFLEGLPKGVATALGGKEAAEREEVKEAGFLAAVAPGIGTRKFAAKGPVGTIGEVVELGRKTRAAVKGKPISSVDRAVTKTIDKQFAPKRRLTSSKALKEQKASEVSTMKHLAENVENLEFETAAGEAVTGRLPRDVAEFSGALDSYIANQMKDAGVVIEKATGKAPKVSAGKLAREVVDEAMQNKVGIAQRGAGFVEEAGKWADDFMTIGEMDVAQVSSLVKELNKSFRDMQKNPSQSNVTRVQLGGELLTKAREALFEQIKSVEDVAGVSAETFKQNRRRLASAIDLRKSVSKKTETIAKQNPGLFEKGVGTAAVGNLAAALGDGFNPAQLSRSAGQAAFGLVINALFKDANRATKIMFEKLGKEQGIKTKGSARREAIGTGLRVTGESTPSVEEE